MADSNRLRDKAICFRMTGFDRDIIMHNYEASGQKSFQEFVTKVLTDGYVVNIDTSGLQNYAYEINKIGVNLNQIAHRVNMLDKDTPDIFLLKQDVKECLFLMQEVSKIVRRHWISG